MQGSLRVLVVLGVPEVLVLEEVLVQEVVVVLGQPATPSSPAQGCIQIHTLNMTLIPCIITLKSVHTGKLHICVCTEYCLTLG